MKKFVLPKDGGLFEDQTPKGILHSYEKIPTQIFEDELVASARVADEIISIIKAKGGKTKIGLSTGRTPIALYKELSRRYKAKEVSFADVEIYSIDEFNLPALSDVQKRNHFLVTELINNIDIRPENFHVPTSDTYEFEHAARGLDILVMGVGEQGQVGLNEVGSSEKSRTRSILMSYQSRKRQSSNFAGDVNKTPKTGITMGISTMLRAERIILMAWGEDKANVVFNAVEGPATSDCPVSLLQKHDNITFYIDEFASTFLTRVNAPWLVGPCEWTRKFMRKAVVWLCEQVHKPILKLTHEDYVTHSLGELLEQYGTFDKVNIDVFNDLQHTITGWPGGKPNADDSTRPVPSVPSKKRVVIFSPHPDDDVISMGGTFIRLVEQGHDVHVAYETSGNVAVHDSVVMQMMDAAHELGFADKFEEVQKIVDSKRPGQPEPRALLDIKAAIRRSEARGAVRSFGLNENTNAHFLNLPFYETGGIKKGERTQADIDIIINLLQDVKPHQIYLAGDLADPHGTHRVCTEAVLAALEQLKDEEWMKETHVWLYRGAWMEWELGKVDMAVPLSPDEVIKKRHAIYRHLSQKDIVPFPGEDPREFWQRAEERTQNTAKLYDELGMAEYQAVEVFVKLF